MLQENLERANELAKLIAECKTNILKWENVYEISSRIDAKFKGAASGYNVVYLKDVPLNVLKAISLDAYQKELRLLELEFSNLN